MKKIIFSIILSFVFAFQAYGAKPILKPAGSTMNLKPSGTKKLMIKKPDLIVEKFVLAPSSVQNGEPVDYELIIKNIGGPSTHKRMLVSFHSSPNTGKSEYMAVPNPGQSLSFHGTTIAPPSDACMSWTYTVELDTHKQIIESNEDNNTASYSVSIQGRPVIGFCTLATHAQCPELFINGGVGDDDIYIGFEVHNFGCSVSPAGTMDLVFPEQWPQTIPIPPIQPGKFFPFYTYMKWLTPGVKNGEIILRYNQSNVKIYNDRIKYKVNIVAP